MKRYQAILLLYFPLTTIAEPLNCDVFTQYLQQYCVNNTSYELGFTLTEQCMDANIKLRTCLEYNRVSSIPPAPKLQFPPSVAPSPTPSRPYRNFEDCSVYSSQESLCGKSCEYINQFTESGSEEKSECNREARECRANASRQFNDCLNRNR